MLFKGVETPFKGLRSPFSTITRNFFSGGFGWWGVQPPNYFWKTLREPPPHSPPPKLPPGGIYPLLDGKELNGALENCVAERKKCFCRQSVLRGFVKKGVLEWKLFFVFSNFWQFTKSLSNENCKWKKHTNSFSYIWCQSGVRTDVA